MYMPYLKSLLGVVDKEIENNKMISQKMIQKYYGLNKRKSSDAIVRNAAEKFGTISCEVDAEVEDFCLLNDGALILIDNTLWKGLVLSQVFFASFSVKSPHIFVAIPLFPSLSTFSI